MNFFSGLSAFPLTPLRDDDLDEAAYTRLITRLVDARVDTITALGSTGSYAYLNREERRRVVQLAVSAAREVPLLAGIGATRTRDVLHHADDAQAAGASALLVAPVSYQPLTEDEVFDLFSDIAAEVSVPIVVYDNPGTTGFTFTDELHARIAAIPAVASIKIPPVEGGPAAVQNRVQQLRGMVPPEVTIGISGDAVAADALLAGCESWYSVLAGILPRPCRDLVRAAADGDADRARQISEELAPVWQLFSAYGSYRVVSALAEDLGLVDHPNLPRPVQGLPAVGRAQVRAALRHLIDSGVVDS